MPHAILRIAVFTAALLSITGVACIRNLNQKKEPVVVSNPQGRAAVKGKTEPEDAVPPAPPGGAIQPPRSEQLIGSVPPLPRMPGSASRPTSDQDLESELMLASTDDERKGILQRLRERREQRNQNPTLPPALEPPPKKDPPKKDPQPPVAPPGPMPQPETPGTAQQPVPAKGTNSLAEVRKLIEVAAKSYADTQDFTAKLIKHDAVNGKLQPQEEIEYSFRKEPLSVHMKVVGENGYGREVVYVKGQNGGKMTVVTGKGDLFGSGIKREIDPDSILATSRARTKIYEAGFARPIGVITKFLDQADAGKRPADTIRFLGPVTKKEIPTSLTGVELKFLPGDDPLFPKGGTRSYYFDTDPKSQSFGLPVLITAVEGGKEVEYYAFTNFHRPAKLTDADFSPDRLGKKK